VQKASSIVFLISNFLDLNDKKKKKKKTFFAGFLRVRSTMVLVFPPLQHGQQHSSSDGIFQS